MARVNSLLHAFNRGVVSKYALGRVDVDRLRLSAETMTNWVPKKLGPMSLRPGLQQIMATKSNAAIEPIPFIASTDEYALLQLGTGVMRVQVDDALVTRGSVSTAVTNGDFSASAGWTLTATGGASATISGGKLTLAAVARGGNALCKRSVTVGASDQNDEHALRIVVDRGPVLFRCGSTDGGEEYIEETTLRTGTHSLAFTPTGNFYVQFETRDIPNRIVDSITVESSGTMEITIPWTAGDLPSIKWAQSADVMFVACPGYQTRRIERRGETSWSVVLYDTNDGPFSIQPTSTISITPSATIGNVTLTASRALFRDDHIGALFRLFQNSQNQTTSLGAENTFTSAIRITGARSTAQGSPGRDFTYSISNDASNLTQDSSFDIVNDPVEGTVSPWGLGRGWTISAGEAHCDGSQTANSRLAQVILTAGTTYTVRFKVTSLTAGTIKPQLGGTNGTSRSAVGTYSESVVCGSGTTFSLVADSSFIGTVDEVTVIASGAGTWDGTLTLQRSFDGPDAGFVDVRNFTTGTNGPVKFSDPFDNSIVYYRIGFKTGSYTSGTATVTLTYGGGGGPGVVRVTAVTNATSASAEVVSELKSAAATYEWLEGEFSDNVIWPEAVRLFDGRLWFGARDTVYGSMSDAFDSFDYEAEGDSAPIIRSIGEGPVQGITSLLGLQRLLALGDGAEISVKSSSFDEPLTPTSFSMKRCSTQGAHTSAPVEVDSRGIFIQKSQRRIYELYYSVESQDYQSRDLTAMVPNFGDSDFERLAVQRQPDTRIHVPRADGTVACLVFEPDEEVLAWFNIETDGEIERVAVLPGPVEDQVYYVVKRTINGSDVRYIEKFAREDQCLGSTLNRQADSFKVISQASSTTISGLTHLEGETVVVWANGKDLGEYTVASGAITVSEAVTSAIVGLPYTAQFKSAKLAYGAQLGTAINQRKRIDHMGLVMFDTHYQGLEYGQDFDHLDPLPAVELNTTTAVDTVWSEYDEPVFSLNGTWDTDARLCLQAEAPKPCTVAACVIGIDTKEKG